MRARMGSIRATHSSAAIRTLMPLSARVEMGSGPPSRNAGGGLRLSGQRIHVARVGRPAATGLVEEYT
jgi:hypothetical protein